MSPPVQSTVRRRSSAAGVQLPVTPEPTAVKRATRTFAEEHPTRAAELLAEPEGTATHLWERWAPELERGGMSHEEFLAVLHAYRRELWHWLWGDRTWEQCSQGLAGRLARRAGRPIPLEAPPTRGDGREATDER